MPIVRTKKAIEGMSSGQVIEVQATDKGSLADLQAWSRKSGHDYLGTVTEGELMRHFVRKSHPNELKQSMAYPHTVTNDELTGLVEKQQEILILDVREAAEFAFQHVPGAVSIPLGQLEERVSELSKEQDIYVICRTGIRSDLACQLLMGHGFLKVKNVLPGMSGWSGRTVASI
ncbi:sulfurtransferase TusA family protein [Paenibacillus sp. GSMTC-2017]|nr:sulfurtransferase TusA family protein [Paenibacillus sp. GSMTC-2017]